MGGMTIYIYFDILTTHDHSKDKNKLELTGSDEYVNGDKPVLL